MELTIKEDFLPLELGGLDLILGLQWLQLKDDIGFWGKKFHAERRPDIDLKDVFSRMMTQTTCTEEDQGLLVEFQGLNVAETTIDKVQPKVEQWV